MENKEKSIRQDDIYSKAVRAGKRTYFFDVKSTKADDYYLTITESTKRFNDDGTFRYEKHRIFLYKEDFEKFSNNLKDTMEYIVRERGEEPIRSENSSNYSQTNETTSVEASTETSLESKDEENSANDFTDISFDDLGTDTSTEESVLSEIDETKTNE